MNNAKTKTLLSTTIGTLMASALSVSVAQADVNPFGATELTSGYMVVAEGSCGNKGEEAKCGANKQHSSKSAEGSCGENKSNEGKCGADKKHANKNAEGACGGDKGSEGKCGADKRANKSAEGACGEGKCGGQG